MATLYINEFDYSVDKNRKNVIIINVVLFLQENNGNKVPNEV